RERAFAPAGPGRCTAAHQPLHQPAQPDADARPLLLLRADAAQGVQAADCALLDLRKLHRKRERRERERERERGREEERERKRERRRLRERERGRERKREREGERGEGEREER